MDAIPKVQNIMSKKLITLSPDDSIETAVEKFGRYKISGAPVMLGKVLAGIITERDCLKVVISMRYEKMPIRYTVDQFMSKDVLSISPSVDIFTAAQIFLDHNYRRLPVIDPKNRLVGIISRKDVLLAAQKAWDHTLEEDRMQLMDYHKSGVYRIHNRREIPEPYKYGE